MTKFVESTGKTIEEAVSIALSELNTEKNKVDIEVMDEGNKGLFGLIGSKMARVKVKMKQDEDDDRIQNFLSSIFKEMDLDVTIDVTEGDETINVDLKGNNMGILIGRRGETLDALQYLTGIIANRGKENYKKVLLDTENYRQKREDALVKLANKVADRVVKFRKSVTLEPMNPFERRIIHSALQSNSQIETYSVGDEPNRKVVIALK